MNAVHHRHVMSGEPEEKVALLPNHLHSSRTGMVALERSEGQAQKPSNGG